jgi:hypothetical protein
MPHGGARRGAGRKSGFNGAGKRTQLAIRRWARELAPEKDFADPAVDVMRGVMTYHWRQAYDEAKRVHDYLIEHNATPEELLKCVALYHRSMDKALEAAEKVAPYESPKLSQLTVKVTDIPNAPDPELNAALIGMGVDLEALLAQVSDADFVDMETTSGLSDAVE